MRIRNYEVVKAFFDQRKLKVMPFSSNYTEGDLYAVKLSKQFSSFFNAYAKAYNKIFRRKGHVYMHTFKRKRVDTEFYLLKVLPYIHLNPVKSGLCKKPEEWPYSSYADILRGEKWIVSGEEVVGWYGGVENLRIAHRSSASDIGEDIPCF